MGGSDGFYVAADVEDVRGTALNLATGKFDMNGENCDACERIFVHADIFEQFCQEFVRSVESFTVGDANVESTYIGPLYCAAQVTRMQELVDDAVQKGATLACGGAPARFEEGSPLNNGFFYLPTVLLNCDSSMRVFNEEVFGPVVGLQRIPEGSTVEQIAQEINNSPYGLTAGVYSKDKQLATEILEHVDCGTVYWNKHGVVEPWMPWAGRKDSGSGTFLGLQGIRECFCKTKACFF
eukprot:TRINITY_DN13654_c0_g3_i3.p1 TRINITY_DN13654_c0_g3~~TRINITY_DN13654_c0_g3_i3.p1  ORF type:complete len:238 (-),score=60.54 TRINITY_DN13654_c0_g3_i3:316-1029(-)